MKVIRIVDPSNEIRFAALDPATGDAHVLVASDWEQLHKSNERTGEVVAADSITLAPLVNPSKIVGMAMAFLPDPQQQFRPGVDRDPFFFFKPPSAIIADGDTIEVPSLGQGSVFESELAAVIGARCKGVSAEEALDYVVGYTVCNDMSATKVMNGDGQWSRGKGFDTFCPIGPVIETELANPEDAHITATITRGGEVLDLVDSTTANQIWSVAQSIAYCSANMTLEPGDVVSMGCPPGPIPVEDGDIVTITVDNVGTLSNPVTQL